MRDTGIVRRVDELGRLVVPKELRRTMGIEEKDPMEIFTDGESIVIKKYVPGCLFCGSLEELVEHKGKFICPACIKALRDKKSA